MKILYMGTPKFSKEILKSLVDEGMNIKAVITNQDKKSGRGQKVKESEVKSYALEKNICVFCPKTLRDPEVIEEIRNIGADIIVVVAYGKILPKEVLDIPKLGCINLHGSLLPKYRGARTCSVVSA